MSGTAVPLLAVLLYALASFPPGSGDHSVSLCNNGTVDYDDYKSNIVENCGCASTNCVRKCCQSGYYLYHDESRPTKDRCVRNTSLGRIVVPIFDKEVLVSQLTGGFMVGMLNCDGKNGEYFKMNSDNPTERYYIQVNGSLYYPTSTRKFYPNDRYCIDEGEGISAYLCYTPADPQAWYMRLINCLGMIISMPFLLATLIVYALLPESNLHRKALMFYVATLLLAYIILVSIQLNASSINDAPCKFLGYSVIFFFMGSFFWMNVMCIDMWLAFSGLRGFTGQKNAERKRFLLYCLYALGMPTVLVTIAILLDTYGNPDEMQLPGVGKSKCFLEDGLPNLYYFYGPMALIILLNVGLFISTAIKIRQVKKETSMLKQSDSKRHSYEDDKQKFSLYLKLLFAMGINWTMELISWVFLWKMDKEVPPFVWYLTDFVNAMYGVFIFFIFVFKKKIWRSLQKRYYLFRGKPHLAHSLTTTQTTRSMSTTETGTNDHRLSELKNAREERPLARS